MSYILDALKKSEKLRQQGDVPDLQTVHMPMLEEEKSNRFLYLIIIVLSVSVAFLLGVYQPWNSDSDIEKPPIVEEKIEVEIEKKNDIEENQVNNDKSLLNQPRVMKQEKSNHIVEAKEKNIKPKINVKPESEISQQSIRDVPRLLELPEIVQQAIPNMIFAGHVYSSNPSQRSIIINGYAMSEGDMIVDGLRVKHITRDGVIFDYQGQLFRKEILQDWSFD